MEYLSLLEIVREMEMIGIPRIKTILCLQELGIGCEDELTTNQCAELLNVSRSRIKEIEGNALMKIHEGLCNEHND